MNKPFKVSFKIITIDMGEDLKQEVDYFQVGYLCPSIFSHIPRRKAISITHFSKRSAHENHPNFLRSLGDRPYLGSF